jgi:hypothetical protein
MADHPDISALLNASKELLLEAMHNKDLPLNTRVDIAIQLVNRWPGQHEYVPPAIVIRIEGLGNNPPELIGPEVKVQVH